MSVFAITTTKMFLAAIHENPATGHFQGLGLTGPFIGTATSSGPFHFEVKIDVGGQKCDGKIKVGGDLEAYFHVFDLNENPLDEYGPLYAHANA